MDDDKLKKFESHLNPDVAKFAPRAEGGRQSATVVLDAIREDMKRMTSRLEQLDDLLMKSAAHLLDGAQTLTNK